MKLQEVNHIKDKLFSVIAHDLRSPFNSFKSMVDLYDAEILSKEDTDFFFQQISKDASYINSLLDNLLIWAKSQMEGFNLSLKTISIKRIFDEVIYLQKNAIRSKRITIINNIPIADLVSADYEMVKVIARNLVSNAIKFTPEGGNITISSTREGDELKISVADTGIGLSTDQKCHLFQNDFYSTRGLNNEKGTGVGLQISKEFLEKHNGKIWVESEAKKGSTFFFTLPVDKSIDISNDSGNEFLLSDDLEHVFISDEKSQGSNDLHAEDQYELLGRVTNGTVYDYDIINNQLTWNKGLAANFGHTNATTSLEWWTEHVHPYDVEEVEMSLNAAIHEKKSTWKHEYRFQCSDKSYKYVNERGLILFNEDGNSVRMIGVMEDIQERKDASAEMLRLSLVAKNVTNLVVITDHEDKVVWVNNAFEQYTGYKLEEVIGKRPRHFLCGEHTDSSALESLDKNLVNNAPITTELLNYTKQGKPYWVQIDCTPYFDPLSNNIGYVTIQTIITDRKEKEQLILKKNEALREIARISSHEVRSPLSSILGLVDLLQQSSNQKELEECLQLLNESSKQLDRIIYKIQSNITDLEEVIEENR
jgi:PAS domain S-box-containing protein